MKLNSLIILLVLINLTYVGSTVAEEESKELKAAREKATIAEMNAKAAENDYKAAENQSNKAIVEEKAKLQINDLKAKAETSELTRDAAQVSYYKSLIPNGPDPSKLKAEKPDAFDIKTSINQRLFQNTTQISHQISNKIADLNSGSVNESRVIILDTPFIQKAPSIFYTVEKSLALNQALLAQENILFSGIIKDKNKICEPEKKKISGKFGLELGAPYVASELLKTVMGFALAFKPQSALSSTSVSVEQSEFIMGIANDLITKSYVIIDPDKIITNLKVSSKLDENLEALNKTLIESRKLLEQVNREDCTLTSNAVNGAKQLKISVDTVAKFLDSLITTNPSTGVPFEQAKKAEQLLSILEAPNVTILKLEITRNSNDTYAKQGVFSSKKVYDTANVQVKWSLSKTNGQLVLASIEQSTAEWTKVNLPD